MAVLQKCVNLEARLEPKEPSHLFLRESTGSITLERETFRGRTTNIVAACTQRVCDVFRQVDLNLHGAVTIMASRENSVRQYPTGGFVRQAVERNDGLFQMLFLRVFDFVVADAAQRLREHHDRWHSRARYFGGVV